MATIIKSIPTLYGSEARRFQNEADSVEEKYDNTPKRDRESDPYVRSMRRMLKRSNFES